MTDDWEDVEALEEHLEEVKPEPVAQEELDELVEPATELRPVQDGEQAVVDDASRGAAGDAEEVSVDSELDALAEPVTELRTVQEREAADEGGDADE